MGPSNQGHNGVPMPMTLEPWPGGRWFRNLGDNNGHLWGHVQAIKRPTLLEITGPLMMSFAVASNVQYRLKEVDGGTLITLRHTALGLFPPDGYREALGQGWSLLFDRLRRRVENGITIHRSRNGRRTMALIDGMLQELEQESQTTRRVLERVPDNQLAWRPHPKARTLGQLALHIATVPGGVAQLVASPSPVQAPQFADPDPKSAAELIPALDQSIATAKKVLGGMDDATIMATWRMMHGDRELLAVRGSRCCGR